MIDLTWLHLHTCDEKKAHNHLTKLKDCLCAFATSNIRCQFFCQKRVRDYNLMFSKIQLLILVTLLTLTIWGVGLFAVLPISNTSEDTT